jgi:hypothetical protein
LQSPLFLDERTSLVATCSPKLAERPRPPKLAERRRKAEGASDTHHDLDGRDGFRGKLNPSCDLLPDGLFNLPDGQISKNLSSPFCKNISVFQKCKPDYMICRPVPLEGRFAIVTDAGRDAVDADAPITNGAEADGEGVWS